jgi:hypothetical protein
MTEIDTEALARMLDEAKRLESLTTKELATEASERLPLLGPDCLLVDEVTTRLRRLAAWEIRKARSERQRAPGGTATG